uniref:histone acetyltransferase n=1 Tax=Ananas comosus var. bracteatus TaxID=296719 RepID=A0A6V7Q9U6_ANACO|nr:unnamed protein product [Ananas comosus var. bracteatus]
MSSRPRRLASAPGRIRADTRSPEPARVPHLRRCPLVHLPFASPIQADAAQSPALLAPPPPPPAAEFLSLSHSLNLLSIPLSVSLLPWRPELQGGPRLSPRALPASRTSGGPPSPPTPSSAEAAELLHEQPQLKCMETIIRERTLDPACRYSSLMGSPQLSSELAPPFQSSSRITPNLAPESIHGSSISNFSTALGNDRSSFQRYRPNGQHRVVASFSSCSNGTVMDSIGSILGTNFAHQASDSSYLCSTPYNTSLARAVQNNGASSNILCVRDNGSRSLNDQTRMIFEQYNIYDNTHLSSGSEACVPWMRNSSLSALGSCRKSNFMDNFNCESPGLLDRAGMASVLGLGHRSSHEAFTNFQNQLGRRMICYKGNLFRIPNLVTIITMYCKKKITLGSKRTESCSAFLSSQNETFKEQRPALNSNGSSSQGSSRTFQGTLMSTNVSSEIQDVSMNQKFLDSSTSKADDWNANLVRLEETKVQREQEKTKMQNEVDDVAVEIQENAEIQNKDSDFVVRMQEDPHIKDEDGNINEGSDFVPDTECKPDSLQVVTPVVTESNLGNSRIKVVSLVDTFTAEKIREHLKSLQQCSGQGHAKSGQSQQQDRLRTCTLCGMEQLVFETPPRFCALCSKQINPRGLYYENTAKGDYPLSFCSKCFKVPGEVIKTINGDVPKVNLDERRCYAETDTKNEPWLTCVKCNSWVHQICALFNGEINQGLKVEHTCLHCILEELESGGREPLQPRLVFEAQNLPTTMLSDHIEQRLFHRLKQDRKNRSDALGKNIEEVPGAEGLTVRVVSSVERKLEVRPLFHDIFKEKYPKEFPYKSKAILLFQKIDGVDVCLFAMYVQEYGSECPFPNQRHVYLSYIDSVKYFTPGIKAASGEALRTFVYHEILIGYLDYCKKRGFVSCSIWVCPSVKRDDYILYCHPTTQKMPRAEKLRDWYHKLISKATIDDVIVEHTNLHDRFFLSTGEHNTVTAANLPYCEGDYWPVEAEVLLKDDSGSTSQKKGAKAANDRMLRAYKRGSVERDPKDMSLMHKLGEKICPKKEEFIMIYLQYTCKHCRLPLMSAEKWKCTTCKMCYTMEQQREHNDKHPSILKEKHSFRLVQQNALPDTDDGDEALRIGNAGNLGEQSVQEGAAHIDHEVVDNATKVDNPMLPNKENQHKQTIEDALDALVHASRCEAPHCMLLLCNKVKRLFHHGSRCSVHFMEGVIRVGRCGLLFYAMPFLVWSLTAVCLVARMLRIA